MINSQIFIPPLLGGVIGYITNDIAIKMLFHPRKPIYIGKFKLPFTPGLIPKEKERVAKSLGKTISNQLLDAETLKNVFTSEEMMEKIKRGLEKVIDDNRTNADTVQDVILKVTTKEVADSIISGVRDDVTELIHSKLTSFEFGENISKSVIYKVKEKIDSFTFGVLSSIVDDNLINGIAKSIGEVINRAIADNSREIVSKLIDNEIDKIKECKVCSIIEKYEEKIPILISFVLSTYKRIINENLENALKGINIAKIVENKIASFDVVELENMILELMKKELKAIVYLGALLGFIMGWLNLLITL